VDLDYGSCSRIEEPIGVTYRAGNGGVRVCALKKARRHGYSKSASLEPLDTNLGESTYAVLGS